MEKPRKITIRAPKELLEKTQASAGEGVSQTVTAALKRPASFQAQQELLNLRGRVKFSVSYGEIKRERE